MRRIALMLALWPGLAGAGDWQALGGDQVRSALQGRALVYENGARQEFRASGRTLYNAGQDSWGYWQVRDDQYCSTWPPSDLWACYDLATRGDQVRFTGATGDVSVGRYAP